MIPTRLHGIIDYSVAALFGGLSASSSIGPRVRRVLGGAGAYHAGYSAVTDYDVGAIPLISMRQHLALDVLGAAALCGAGILMRREVPRDRALLIAAGLSELAVVALSERTAVNGPRQGSGRRERGLSPARTSENATYPPLDTPKPVADDIWVVDSGPMKVAGMPLPVRMTVVRLPGGDLLLHSPTAFSVELKRELERIGPIRYLVAPNIAHWTFLKPWQEACPDADTWAAPGLRERAQVRKAGVKVDHELTETPPRDWGDFILVVVPGGAGFRETAFFHKPTRTLILTDLVLNLEPSKLPTVMGALVRLVGAAAPNGRAPIYLRALIKLKRHEAAAAASQLLDLKPERVIFTHGRWFERDGTAALRQSLSWLVA